MANNSINLKEALAVLESGEWVSLRFITAHVKKGVGGMVIETPKCRICRHQPQEQAQLSTNDTDVDASDSDASSTGKNPNHNLHFTRNIEFPNKRIITIHPPLITHINQNTVL